MPQNGYLTNDNSLEDLMSITQMKGHIYASDMPAHTGIVRVTDWTGYERNAKGAEIKSTGAAGKLRVHPVNSNQNDGTKKWYDLELFPTVAGMSPKGCYFDYIDWTNSTVVYTDVCILF